MIHDNESIGISAVHTFESSTHTEYDYHPITTQEFIQEEVEGSVQGKASYTVKLRGSTFTDDSDGVLIRTAPSSEAVQKFEPTSQKTLHLYH